MARTRTQPLSRRVLVIIDRDITAKTSSVIWQHEIPILEAVFGEGKVTPQDAKTLNEGFSSKVSPDLLPYNKVQDAISPPSETSGIGWVFVGDARTEYDRLVSVYGLMPNEERLFVEAVYGRFSDGRAHEYTPGALVLANYNGMREVSQLPCQRRANRRKHTN